VRKEVGYKPTWKSRMGFERLPDQKGIFHGIIRDKDWDSGDSDLDRPRDYWVITINGRKNLYTPTRGFAFTLDNIDLADIDREELPVGSRLV
jgi:hypothetical protein